MYYLCDRVALPLACSYSPWGFFLTGSFLGTASNLPWFGCLAIYDKSPGCLCHAKHASLLGYSHLLCFFLHAESAALGFSCNLPEEKGKYTAICYGINNSALCSLDFEGLPSRRPRELSVFFRFVTRIIKNINIWITRSINQWIKTNKSIKLKDICTIGWQFNGNCLAI
jgi:hypothetical protein